MMTTNRISITEAKQKLGELVKRAAYGHERFVLEFRGKPQAVIVSCEDFQRLPEEMSRATAGQLELLEKMAALRRRIAARTTHEFDAATDLRELRESRIDQISGLH